MINAIKKLIHSASFWAIADQAIFSGSNFLMTLFLAHQLVIPDFGIFASLVLLVYLIMSISNAFIIQPFQVSYYKAKNQGAYLSFLFASFLLSLAIILLCLSIIFLFVNPDYMEKSNYTPALLFIATYLFQDFFRKLFLALSNVILVVFTDILFLAIVIIGSYIHLNSLTLNAALYIIAIANCCSALPALIILLKKSSKPLLSLHFLKDHINQGRWLTSVAILQWCSSNFFVLVSGIYLGIEALAALRLVQSFFGLLNITLQSVENFFLPKIASLYQKDPNSSKHYLLKITGWGAVLFGIVLLILFIFPEEVLVLVGGVQYSSFAFVVRIMTILYGMIFLSYPLRIGLRVLLMNKVFFTGYLISFLFSLLSFHFLLRYSALYGAVLGLILNQIIMLIYWLSQFKKNKFLLCR